MAYSASKDPFLQNEDDDYSFEARGRSKVSYSTSSGGYNVWEEPAHQSLPKSHEEQMQEMKENAMNRTLASTHRALASIYDSERVGIATAEELVHQGEQLDNIEQKTTTINAEMKQTQRNLNGMKSYLGWFKNWLGGDRNSEEKTPQKETQTSSRPDNPALRDAMNQPMKGRDVHPAMRARNDDISGCYDDQDDLDAKFMASSAMGGARGGAGPEQRAAHGMSSQQTKQKQEGMTSFDQYDQQFNENLDMMSDGMAHLKMMATGMSSEITAQNDQIENRILPNVERADSSIRNQNRQMKKMLGVKK